MNKKALAAALLCMTGCSVLLSTSNLAQQCDLSGDCLSGYTCVANKCLKTSSLIDAGPTGCATQSQDTDCPAGACVGGLCANDLTGWSNGSYAPPDTSCFASFPPAQVDAGAYAGLTGCIVTLPGDIFSGEPSLFLGGGSGQAIVAPAAGCGPDGGYSYYFTPFGDGGGPGVEVPIGQFFELDTFTDAGTEPIRTYPVFISAAQAGINPQRNAFSISPGRISSLLSQMNVKLPADGGYLGGGTLLLGIVNDCTANLTGGDQLSGVQVVVDQFSQPVFYLDAQGNVVPGRTATDPSGMFASYLTATSPSLISVTYEQQVNHDAGSFGPGGTPVNLAATVGGVLWVPLSPSGP